MSKKLFLIFILLILILPIFSTVFAQNMEILTPESSVIIYTGEANEIKIPIRNKGPESDTIYVSVWPTKWVTLDKYRFTVNSGESELLSLLITPPEDIEEGTHVFTITTKSLNTNESSSNSLFLNVKRKTNVFISELKLNKELINSGEILGIESVLTNLHKTQKHKVFLTTKILDSEDRMIKKFEENFELEGKTVKIIKNFYEIDKFQSYGNYKVKIQLRDSLNILLDEEEKSFEIQKHFEIKEYKTKEYGLFYSLITIEVVNEGNTLSSDYRVEESLPKITDYFFFPEIEPSEKEEKDNRVLYTWELSDLTPGQTTMIRYKLRFYNVLITVLVVSILSMIGYEYITKPLLEKKYYGLLSGEDELKITLNIKNKRKKTLRNVIVKDIVPSVAKVVKKFDTKTPEIKLKTSGTELIWEIDKIKPKEELILTYKIKPLIDVVGRLTLPRSYFTYSGKFRRESRIVSKSVSITGKIK